MVLDTRGHTMFCYLPDPSSVFCDSFISKLGRGCFRFTISVKDLKDWVAEKEADVTPVLCQETEEKDRVKLQETKFETMD